MLECGEPHESRFRALVAVHTAGGESIMTAPGGGDGNRDVVVIVAEEPRIRHFGQGSVSLRTRGVVGRFSRQEHRRRVYRLLVEPFGLLAAPPPAFLADQREAAR